MNNILNQNGKVLEETLPGSNSNAVKTTLRGPCCFKMTLPPFQLLGKSFAIPLSLCDIQ